MLLDVLTRLLTMMKAMYKYLKNSRTRHSWPDRVKTSLMLPIVYIFLFPAFIGVYEAQLIFHVAFQSMKFAFSPTLAIATHDHSLMDIQNPTVFHKEAHQMYQPKARVVPSRETKTVHWDSSKTRP